MMDRRQILSRLPLIPMAVAGVVGGPVAAEPSELMRLFSEWDACDRMAWGVETDEETNALCEQMRRVEVAMMAIPATTAAEFAAKIVAFTSYGDWMPNRDFIAEAAGACGASRATELGSGPINLLS